MLAVYLVKNGYISLEFVPRLTMGAALLFQLLPAALVLNGKAEWLTKRWVVLASIMALALAPLSEEAWLNILHIQFQLVLCCVLLLAFDVPRSAGGWIITTFVLVLAPLSGLAALVLGPLFLARSLLDRSLPRLVQTALLGCSGLIQLLFFYSPSAARGQLHSLAETASIIFVRLGVVPIGGPLATAFVRKAAIDAYLGQGLEWFIISGLGLLYCGFLIWVTWCYRHTAVFWIFASAIVLAVTAFGGGMIASPPQAWFDPSVSQRYNVMPMALLGLGLVAVTYYQTQNGRMIAFRLCELTMLTALCFYFVPNPVVSEGPRWSAEVARWRTDQNYKLRVWPRPWAADLSAQNRPCRPPTRENASLSEPEYCESHWLATVDQINLDIANTTLR
ncbi:hypothetical protein H7F51_13285 [Novosphingobium flavum]|uniref:Uncharacterized protein n=1 Tax=Novosphingobium flavum TaxID=1778672 RepID=A0A7X1KMN5_9SPHN|nr:hypothetical protein [Novosphingobium flavum]MBC2666495.1 hypothetical protein [Novosphingobium flavum]